MGDAASIARVWKLCAALVTISQVATFAIGIALVVITASNAAFQWPISSCSGIWTPLALLGFTILSFRSFRLYDFSRDPKSMKPMVVAFYFQLTMYMVFMIQHNTWTFMGLGMCASKNIKICEGDMKNTIIVLEALAGFFCVVILACIITLMLYLNGGGRLRILSGIILNKKGCCSYDYLPAYPEEKDKPQEITY